MTSSKKSYSVEKARKEIEIALGLLENPICNFEIKDARTHLKVALETLKE